MSTRPTPNLDHTAEGEASGDVLMTIRDLAAVELDYRGPLVRESRLIEDLGLDSIRLLTLAVAVEDRFNVCLDEQDEASLVTVGDLIAVIERRREASRNQGEARG